ncbi:MAG: DUF3854 domain-containing protein, partial [Flavobacteriaceae bacterium]|nr:DUF3854 domain-containing protein [Flavobacteriaceae bacterium]
MDKKELKKLTLDDLKKSGLTDKDFKKMGIVPCNDEQASRVLNSTFCTFGYVLPYFDPDGNELDVIRFKFLEELTNKKDKVVKYSQPKGTGVKLYFPPCIKWPKILNDTSIPITFTEGEKKAYKACKSGIPTIGLGGVWSFKSKKQKKDLIDDFKLINLNNRKIYICYDNDVRSNEDVSRAIHAFAKQLNNQGSEVYNKLLPFNPYKKIGLDDYLLDHTADEYYKLEEDTFSTNEMLHQLNREVAFIRKVGKFYILKDEIFVGSSQLKNDIFANYEIQTGDKPLNAAAEWLKWPNRRTHKAITYQPAQPEVTKDNEYNLWRGMGCEPEKGSIKPFMDAVSKIFDNDRELIQWFLDWVAYPIQNPVTKMLTGVLIQSVEQGTGKSSIGLCIGAMYGDNYSLVDDSQLHHSNFNEWAVNRQFILGDEVSGKDKRSESDGIKNLITRPDITINRKYMPSYTVPDCINYIFTSNHPDALNIEPDDRRFFVHRIKHGKGLTLKQGQALESFRKGKGKSYLLNYFLNEHEIAKGFDHRARPPMTEAKEELIEHSLTEIE